MLANIQKKYFIGATSPGKWASVYAYKPHNPEIRSLRGEIFAAISLTSEPGFNVATAGNLLLDNLHENYFENPTDAPLDALEKSLIAVKKHLEKLMEHDAVADVGVEMDLVCMVVFNDLIYFVNLGAAHVHIYRNGNVLDISGILKDPTGEGNIKVGSMVAKNGDVFMLTTPEFSEELSQDELLDIAVEFSEAALRRKKFKEEAKLAAMIVGFNVDRKEARKEFEIMKKIEGGTEYIDKYNEEIAAEEAEIPTAESLHPQIENLEEEIVENKSKIENIREEQERDWEENEAQADFEGDEEEVEKQPIGEKAKELFEKLKLGATKAVATVKQKIAERKNPELRDQAPMVPRQQQLDAKAGVNMDQPTYKVMLDRVVLVLKRIGFILKTVVWQQWLGMGGEKIYLKGGGNGKNWRFIIVVIVVVVGILYFSIKGINERNAKIAADNEAKTHYETAEKLVNDVDKVAGLIAKATGNDDRKQNLINDLAKAETEAGKASSNELYKDKAATLDSKIDVLRDLLNKTIAESNPTLVVDVAGLFPNANPSDIALGGSELFITDETNGKIYRSNLSGSNLREFVGGLTKPQTLTIDNKGNIIFLDQDGDRRMGTIKLEDGSINRHAGTSAFRVGNVDQIEFADIFGGRVYGVDKAIKAVIALQRSGENYGIPEKRFELAGFDTAEDIQIADLKIYVLADVKQGLYRSLNNADDTPILTGLNSGEDLFGATAMYVGDTHVFFADPSTKSILVFTKDVSEMALKARYVYKGSENIFSDIREVVADKNSGKLFVLDGTKIYSLELSKLSTF